MMCILGSAKQIAVVSSCGPCIAAPLSAACVLHIHGTAWGRLHEYPAMAAQARLFYAVIQSTTGTFTKFARAEKQEQIEQQRKSFLHGITASLGPSCSPA